MQVVRYSTDIVKRFFFLYFYILFKHIVLVYIVLNFLIKYWTDAITKNEYSYKGWSLLSHCMKRTTVEFIKINNKGSQ